MIGPRSGEGTQKLKAKWPMVMPPLVRPTTVVVRQASSSFNRKTEVGCNDCRPRDILQLSDEAIEAIIDLLMVCDFLDYMLPAIELVIILLLPKPTGGTRPIG